MPTDPIAQILAAHFSPEARAERHLRWVAHRLLGLKDRRRAARLLRRLEAAVRLCPHPRMSAPRPLLYWVGRNSDRGIPA